MSRSRILIRKARIITMDPVIGDVDRGDLLITGDQITEVAPHIDVADHGSSRSSGSDAAGADRAGRPGRADDVEVVDGTDLIVTPGFVDTHRHTWQSAMRHTYADLDPMQYFAEVLGRVGASYEPDDVRIGNLLGATCALSAGTTTMVDWSHIQNTPAHSDAAIDGLRTAGIRGVFAHGWPLVVDDRWRVESRLGHPQDIRRVRDEHFASDDQLLTLAMAARGPEEAAPPVAFDDLRLARELGIRTTVHVGAYARNAHHHAVAQYHSAGLLGPDMTFVHCNRLDMAEFAMIADAGASVSLGPHCEMNSAGVGDIPLDKLLHYGIRPGLSGDTETKCTGDMFTQMKMIFASYRSWTGGGHSTVPDPAPLTMRDVLEFATVHGARAVGMEAKIGSLTPGKQADLVCIRATDPNLGPVLSPVAAVVLAAHEGNVDSVMVAGRFVKRRGVMTELNTRQIVDQAQESQNRLSARARALAGEQSESSPRTPK